MKSHLSDKERRGAEWERSKRGHRDRRDDRDRGYESHGGSSQSHVHYLPQQTRRQVMQTERTFVASHASFGAGYRLNQDVLGKIDVLVFPYTYRYNTPFAKRTIRFIGGSQKSEKHGPLDTLKRELDEELVDPKKGTINLVNPKPIWTLMKDDEKNPRGYHAKIFFVTQLDRHDVFREFNKIDDSNPEKLEFLEPPYWQDLGATVRLFVEESEKIGVQAHVQFARRMLAAFCADDKVYRMYEDILNRYCSDLRIEEPHPLVVQYLEKFRPAA